MWPAQLTKETTEDLLEHVRNQMTKTAINYTAKSTFVAARLQECTVHKSKILLVNYLALCNRGFNQT
jgi:hypothetical protein